VRTKPKKAPTLALKYVAVRGSTISDEDAAVIGPALEDIASRNAVDNIRSLDKHLVLETVEGDPKHPLRKFYNWNKSEAARAHWLQRTGDLIRSIRIVQVQMGRRQAPTPVFLHVPDHSRRARDEPRRRSSVLVQDVLANDPVYASALSAQIRIIIQALERLEHVTSLRATAPEVVRLRDSIRAAITEYHAEMQIAAE